MNELPNVFLNSHLNSKEFSISSPDMSCYEQFDNGSSCVEMCPADNNNMPVDAGDKSLEQVDFDVPQAVGVTDPAAMPMSVYVM